MQVIVTDERDGRFIELCKSYGCVLDDPQVVLLLVGPDSTLGCASFKVFDSQSVEIVSLFIKSSKNREKISYKLIKQLEKIAIDLGFKASYAYLDEDDLALEIFKKLDYEIVKNDDEILIKKEFRSLI
ncbi:GNAT family N-acetyltransferase [Methanobrevibacter millerae]|uniref:N-acetyltransferase domain-containing protein n=1 Tax=Methanobrevibacter millerae TaxID=230361 RepID=A0A1G5W7S4_9EURY|nr:GNAT family N-acetyltransferase [Methanobrevibacter millerae]SDA54130.1 hypothetical protein SAMN02910315_01220 [Methanobrevibacter millerae]